MLIGVFIIAQKNLNTPKSDKLEIVTTLYPFYNFTKEIVGERADVSLLLPPGVEPHSFEPTPSDIITINESDLIIYTSPIMEPWLSDIISGANKELQTIELSTSINSVTEDPHIWMDFENDQKIVQVITDNLKNLDPSASQYYQDRADSMIQKLITLDESYRKGLAACRRNTIVYAGHYAFKYLTDRYNLDYVAAQGISPDSEPSAQDLASLVNQIRNENISYIFFEELTSPKIAETLQRETDAEILMLSAAHNITRDQFIANISFFDIMEDNLKNLKVGLSCGM